MYIPKLRRINDIVKLMKTADPQAEISWYLLAHLVKTGKISTRKFGNSWLVNLDELYSFFKVKDTGE